MAIGFWQTLTTLQASGTAITAAARTSMTGGSTQGRFTIPANAIKTPGDQLMLDAWGVISCVVTTPGTARFDLALDTTAKLDTTAMPLNIVARSGVPWNLRLVATFTGVGTAAVVNWSGSWLCEAMINTALQATGPGPGGTMVPYTGTATNNSGTTITGTAWGDTTVSHLLDLYFTQTVTTGSCQLLQMNVALLTATGF
jgi:hypothetical protein